MLKEKTVLGGAIVAAFAASLCCIAPLLFVLLGMGTLGMGAIFEPFRPYMMGVAVILLALAYYWIYFKSDDSVSCATGEECATKPVKRASRFGLWLATFVVIMFALTPYITASIANRTSTNELVVAKSDDDCCIANKSSKTENAISADNQPPANSKQVIFTISGMTCVTCEPAIR